MASFSLKRVALGCALVSGLVMATQAVAHPRWVLPNEFTVSSEEGAWITTDATASHGTFVFDKSLTISNGVVITPDGVSKRLSSFTKHRRKSTFDYFFQQEGTHKILIANPPYYRTTYTIGKRDTKRRIQANKVEREATVPEAAKNVRTIKSYNRTEAYVTVNKPSTKVLELEGTFLELVPVTHPSDIVEGETARFQFFFEGKPQAGVDAEIRQDGTLYRNQQEAVILTSDKDGFIEFKPEQAGRYLLIAHHEGDVENDPMADGASGSVHLTFEAVLQ